jgi:hypothetical protein
MAGHVTTLTGLVPCARRIRCTGEAENNNARHCRNSCRIFENKIMLHDLSPISPAKLLYVLSYSHRCAIPYAHAQRHKAKSKKSPAAAREIGMGFAEDHAAMRHQQAQPRGHAHHRNNDALLSICSRSRPRYAGARFSGFSIQTNRAYFFTP